MPVAGMRTDTGGASSSALGVAEGDGVAEADGAGAVDGEVAVLEGTGSAVADDVVAGGWVLAEPVSAQPLTNDIVGNS